jgi:hypothetical protein
MQDNYVIDSDSSSDDEDGPVKAVPEAEKDAVPYSGLSQALLGAGAHSSGQFRDDRNTLLLSKMLDLEEPSVTPKMVDFLMQDGVCESLLRFVTRCGCTPRPSVNDGQSAELKLSYRTTMLLSCEAPNDALVMFLSRCAGKIARLLFDVFAEDSGGSFYHVYRIMEGLLRLYPVEVYTGLLADGLLGERIDAALLYASESPVPEMVVMLAWLSPVPRNVALFVEAAGARKAFLDGLVQWNMMRRLAAVVSVDGLTGSCSGDDSQGADGGDFADDTLLLARAQGALQVMSDLLDKICVDDSSEGILDTLAGDPEVLDWLVDCACGTITANSSTGGAGGRGIGDTETDATAPAFAPVHIVVPVERRKVALLWLTSLVGKMQQPDILCIQSQSGDRLSSPTPVPNRLFAIRGRVLSHLKTRQSDIMAALVAFSSNADEGVAYLQQPQTDADADADGLTQTASRSPIPDAPVLAGEGQYAVRHPGYTVTRPFTILRR